jgi:hypothetical protein
LLVLLLPVLRTRKRLSGGIPSLRESEGLPSDACQVPNGMQNVSEAAQRSVLAVPPTGAS